MPIFKDLTSPLILLSDDSAALALSSPDDGNQRYARKIIRTGKFYDSKSDRWFEVSDNALAHWAKTFALMASRGVDIPVPLEHTDKPDRNRGWVRNMYIKGDSLMADIEAIGEEGKKAVERNSVSVFIPPKWTDGTGNNYDWPIMHVALTPTPVITGLGDARPIAASRVPFDKEKDKMDWTKIKESLDIDVEMTDENAEELVLAQVTERNLEKDDLTAKLVTATEALEASNKELGTLKLSHGKPPAEADPTLVSLVRDNRGMKIDALQAAGKVTKVCADEIRKQYIEGTEGLSLSDSLTRDSGKTDGFDALVAILQSNDNVIDLTELTGAQILLSHQKEGEIKEDALKANAKARAS